MRGTLTAPVEVDVGGELVDFDPAAFDVIALGRELDDRRVVGAADAAASMQLAARAFGQQVEVVGVEAEPQIERPLRREFTIDGQAGIAGAKTQLIEPPVLALQSDAATAARGAAAQSPGQVAEREVEIAAGPEGCTTRFHVEVERA